MVKICHPQSLLVCGKPELTKDYLLCTKKVLHHWKWCKPGIACCKILMMHMCMYPCIYIRNTASMLTCNLLWIWAKICLIFWIICSYLAPPRCGIIIKNIIANQHEECILAMYALLVANVSSLHAEFLETSYLLLKMFTFTDCLKMFFIKTTLLW